MEFESLIEKAYQNFNDRNIDGVFETMDPNVHWPNGWEGGYVNGFDEVRNYWTRQWNEIDPMVYPIEFKNLPDGRIEVEVHQLVKDLAGGVLFDANIKHVYSFENELIKRMEIEYPNQVMLLNDLE